MKQIREFLFKHFSAILIVILVLFLYFKGCFSAFVPQKPIITKDTVWVYKDSTVYSKPQIVQTIPYVVNTTTPPQYIADTNYYKLKAQFEDLRDKFLAKNIQSDTLKIDTIGTVTVKDTTQENKIIGRSYKYDIKYPIITNTVHQKPRNQVYIGFEAGGLIPTLVDRAELGIMFKNKKDNILGLSGGFDFQGRTSVGIKYYQKISFKKSK